MEKNRSGVQQLAPDYEFFGKSGHVPVKQEGIFAKRVAVATYDVAVDGGAAGTHGTGVYLPDNFVVERVIIDVVTTFTDGDDDDATIAVQIQAADDVVAAAAVSAAGDIWDAGIRGSKIGFPNFGADAAHDSAVEVAALFAANMLKLTAEREIAVVTAVDTLTAGKMNIYVQGFISD
jgi:hypothetical protein